MVITLQDSAGAKADLVLVHGAGTASANYAQGPIGGEEVFEAAAEVQTVAIVRAPTVRVRSRGHRTASYPFAALRAFEDPATARAWAAAHAAELDGYDRLAIASGAATTTLHGVASPVRCIVRGVSVEIQYTFVYGATS